MESKVEMSLAEYTALIRENERLRAINSKNRGELMEKAESPVRSHAIDNMTIEQCLATDKLTAKEMIDTFTYSEVVKEIFNKLPCFPPDMIEMVLAENIRQKIQKRIDELNEERA